MTMVVLLDGLSGMPTWDDQYHFFSVQMVMRKPFFYGNSVYGLLPVWSLNKP